MKKQSVRSPGGTVPFLFPWHAETAAVSIASAPGLIGGIMEQFAQAGRRKPPALSLAATLRMLVETPLDTAMQAQRCC
jgi:hypothetical protein